MYFPKIALELSYTYFLDKLSRANYEKSYICAGTLSSKSASKGTCLFVENKLLEGKGKHSYDILNISQNLKILSYGSIVTDISKKMYISAILDFACKGSTSPS